MVTLKTKMTAYIYIYIGEGEHRILLKEMIIPITAINPKLKPNIVASPKRIPQGWCIFNSFVLYGYIKYIVSLR